MAWTQCWCAIKGGRARLRAASFGGQLSSSQLSLSILCVDEEARKQLSNHMYSLVFDFQEFSTSDSVLRHVFFALSGEPPLFLRKPFSRDSDQIDWRWKERGTLLNFNCVPHIGTVLSDAGRQRVRVVERRDSGHPERNFSSRENIRNILAELRAVAFHMQYLQPFVQGILCNRYLFSSGACRQGVGSHGALLAGGQQTGQPQVVQGACAESDPVALKVHASLLQMKVNQARCLPCDTQAEIGRCAALPGGRRVEASRKRRKEASMWDTVVAAATLPRPLVRGRSSKQGLFPSHQPRRIRPHAQ